MGRYVGKGIFQSVAPVPDVVPRSRHYWNDDEKVKGSESLFQPAHVAHEGIRSGQVRSGRESMHAVISGA